MKNANKKAGKAVAVKATFPSYEFQAKKSSVSQSHVLTVSEAYENAFFSSFCSSRYIKTLQHDDCLSYAHHDSTSNKCASCKASSLCASQSLSLSRNAVNAIEHDSVVRQQRTVRSRDLYEFVTVAICADNSKQARKNLISQVSAQFAKSESSATSFVNSVNCCVNALRMTEKVDISEKSIVKRYAAKLTNRYDAKIVLTSKDKASTCYVDKVHFYMKKNSLLK